MADVAGAEYWYVIYKAIGDFADLIKDAAAAKAAMKALSDESKAMGNTEADASNKAVVARERDIASIERKSKSLQNLADSAQAANRQTLFGGRADMGQHLSDLSQESNWQSLLLRTRNLGFTSPQAAYSWRMMELQQAYLMNRAKYGATSSGTGFTNANEYLAYLQREYTAMQQENTAMLQRAHLYRENADAALSYASALRGHATSFGTLGTASSQSLAGISQFQSALVGLPDTVTTTLNIEDSGALSMLSAYQAMLRGVPQHVATSLTASQQRGAIVLGPAPVLAGSAGGGGVLGGGGVGGGGGGGGPPPPSLPPVPSSGGGNNNWGSQAAGIIAAGGAARAAVPALDALGNSNMRLYGWWRLLNGQVTLFGGLFGSGALIGHIARWHVALDSIIELLAILIPSLATAALGLTAWGAAAVQSAQKVYFEFKNILTVSSALNTIIPPLTGNFQKLENAVRPQVFELVGVALDVMNNKTGIFQKLAIETGNVLTRFAARIQVDMSSGGQGLQKFLDTGAKILALFAQIGLNVGHAFMNVLKATEITHVAETLLGVVNVLSKLLDIITAIPAPLLAVLIGLHGLQLWGGLAVTWMTKLGVALAGMFGTMGPLNGLMLKFAGALNATDGQLVKIATHSPAVKSVAEAFGVGAAEVSQFAVAANKGGKSIEELAMDTTTGAALFSKYGASLDKAGKNAVALGIAAGGTEKEVAAIAGSAGNAAAGVGIFGRALAALGGWAGIATAGLALLVIAAGAFAYLAITAKDNTKKWADAINDGLVKSNIMGVVGQTVSDLADSTDKLNHTQGMSAQAIHALTGEHDDLNQKLGLELGRVGQVSKAYGTDFKGALELLNTAGVRTSDLFSKQNLVWKTALEQVHALVEGYTAMGQQTGMIGRDLDVLLVSESNQLKSMNQLNQAWDTFQQLVSAPTDNIIKVGQDFLQFAKDAKEAGAGMLGLSKPQLTLQKDFQGTYKDTQALFDAFRSTQAAGASGNFKKFVQDAVASLIPLAGHNKAAAAEISQLAQEAGGPATTNLQSLAKWAGNVHDPLEKVYQAALDATAGVSNLSYDASILTNTLQKDLTPAMAGAIFNANGGQKVFQAFADAVKRNGPGSKEAATAAHNVATELLAISGNSKNAHAQFIGFAEAMGYSRDKAEALWKSATKLTGTKYKMQLESNIVTEQNKLQVLKDELSKTTDPAKRRQIKLEIHVEEQKLGDLKAKLKDASLSAGDLRKGLADAAPASDNLAKSGFFAQRGDAFRENMRSMGDWFTRVLPHAIGVAGSAISGFFTKTIPGAAGSVKDFFLGLGRDITGIWSHVWSALVSPVVHAFDSVKNAITGGFDGWWKTHGDEVKQVWRDVTGWISGSWNHTFSDVKNIFKGFLQWWDNAVGGIEAAWKFLAGFFKGPSGDIGGIIKAGLSGVKDVFDAIMIWIKADLAVIWDFIAAGFKIAWALMQAAFKIAWDTFVVIVSVILDLITGHWGRAWTDMKNYALQVWHILKNTAITIWNDITTFAKQAWGHIWGAFWTTIGLPLNHFFTRTIPNLFNGFVNGAKLAWESSWNWFHDKLISPVSKWFTQTLPNGIVSGIKTGINKAIDGINTVISFIDNDVLKHLPGGLHIPTLNKLASGGSVPGTGDEDGTHIIAMGGEYMLRKPARMALEAAYGRGFMDHLNQADSWLGSGSRGNAASQNMASGGLVNPIGRGARPGRVDMGVDYSGAFPLYALGSGTIKSLYNSGWPGGAFVDLQLNPPFGSGYWFYAENVTPTVHMNQGVHAGQQVGWATGQGIETGWASGVGGQTAAARDHQIPASGDPGAHPTAWGVAASKLIASLGGPAGIISGKVVGGTPGFGGLVQAWQSVEGLLNAVGDALSGNLKPLAGYVKGGADQLLKLAKLGARAVFDGVWNATVGPMVSLLPKGTIPGAIVQSAAAQVKGGIDAFMGGQDKDAQAKAASMNQFGGGNLGAAGPGPASAQRWMHAHLKDYTWGENQWNPLLALWNGESGWRWNAQNPTSPAYGIPQADPGNKMAAAGSDWRTNPVTQMRWGAEYIRGTPGYGNPANAYRLWLGRNPHWYASGGGIGDDGEPDMFTEMAAGGPFTTVDAFRARIADREKGERAKYYGMQHSFSIGPKKYLTLSMLHKLFGLVPKQAAEVAAYAKLGGKGFTRANLSHLGATARAVESAAGDKAFGKLPGGHPLWQADLRGYLSDLSVLSGQPIPPAVGAVPGIAPEWAGADNSGDFGQLNTAVVSVESPAFWKLAGMNLSAIKGITPKQAGAWHSWRKVLEAQQYKTFGLGHSPLGAFANIQKNMGNPSKITAGQWDAFTRDVNYMTNEEAGKGIKGGINPPGTPANSGWVPWHFFHTQWQNERNALLKVQSRIGPARKVWQNIYGPGHLPYTPGPGKEPTATPMPGGGSGLFYDIQPLVIGGPGSPVFGGQSPDQGFAGGGTVDAGGFAASMGHMASGGTVGLQQVANMFSGLMPGMLTLPAFTPGGISDSMLRRLSGMSGSKPGEAPRKLSQAGAAHHPAFNVEQLTINNPVAEQPSQSIARATNRVAFYAGRGLG